MSPLLPFSKNLVVVVGLGGSHLPLIIKLLLLPSTNVVLRRAGGDG